MKLKIAVSLIIFLLALSPLRALAAPDANSAPDLGRLDQFINAQMRAGGVPGLGLAVVQGEEILYQKGYGKAGPDGLAVTAQTPFLLGSLSKSITGLAVMQLVEAGKVELDAPVQRYIPWFAVADAEASKQITVRHLLNQTSGLPEVVGVKNLADGDLSDGALEKHVRSLRKESLTKPVGTTFQYCNANYVTLGLIVQVASGMPYEEYVQRNIFAPLAMQHSYTAQAAAADPELASPVMATGYQPWFGIPVAAPGVPYVRGDVPAGYLIASAEDMAHFLIANLNAGRFGDKTLVSPDGMALIHQAPGVPGAGFRNAELSAGYGMGWFTGKMAGRSVLHHAGSTANFQAYMVIEPEHKLGFVVLTNTRTPNDLIQDLASGILQILTGGEAPAEASLPAVKTYPIYPGFEYLAVPVIQLVEFGWSAAALRRWGKYPARRPRGKLIRAVQVGIPLILTLGVLALVIQVLAGTASPALFFTFEPASAWLTAVCGGFALAWGVVRTVLWARALRTA